MLEPAIPSLTGVNTLARFRQATQAVHATQTLNQVLTRVIAELHSALNAEAASVALVDREAQELILYAAGPVANQVDGLRLPLNQGIIGWVVQSGQTALVNDTSGDSRFYSDMDGKTGFNTRSVICAPLIVGDKITGAVEVLNKRVGHFGQEDLQFLEVFGSVAASAIENASLYQETQNRLRELTALYEVSRLVMTVGDVGEIYDHLVAQVAELIEAEHCALFLYDPGAQALICRQPSFGPEADFIAQLRLPLSQNGLIKEVVDAEEPLISNELWNEPGFAPFQSILDRLHARSVLGCAIKTDESEFGLLVAANKRGKDRFSEQDRKLAAIMIQQANLALQRVRLQQRQQRDAYIQTALLEVSRAISNLTNLDKLLEFVVRISHRLVGCDHCLVCLWDEKSSAFVPKAESGLPPDLQGCFTRFSLKTKDIPSLDYSVKTRSPVLMTEEKLSQAIPNWAIGLFGGKNCILVPLATQRRVVGNLVAAYNKKARPFTDWEVDLMIGIARQAAVAVENVGLYRELQTHSIELEQALRELQQADELKSQFIQNVSHELRTPLTFIKGYTELLLEGQLGELSQEQGEGLQRVAERTDQLCRLVDDVMTLQTIDQSALDCCPIDLRVPVSTAVQNMMSAAEQAGVRFHIEVPSDLPLVWADGLRIHQALSHLLENAVKFSPQGGTVLVRAWVQGGQMRVEIQDTGIGIPPEALPHIFARFYQVDGSTTRRFGGTGLGLAIVEEIIKSHGGRVGVQSQEGQGSNFFFTLPLSE